MFRCACVWGQVPTKLYPRCVPRLGLLTLHLRASFPFRTLHSFINNNCSLIEVYPYTINYTSTIIQSTAFLDTHTDLFRDKYLDDVDAFRGILLRNPIID
jgi:hypothetical protein